MEESANLLHCQSVLERTGRISMMIEESRRNERRVETAILDNGGLLLHLLLLLLLISFRKIIEAKEMGGMVSGSICI